MFFLSLLQRWWWWCGRLVYCVLLCGLSSCLLFLSPHPPVYNCPLALYHLNHHHHHHLHHHYHQHHHPQHHHHHYSHSIIIIFIAVYVVKGKELWWHYLFLSALCLQTSCWPGLFPVPAFFQKKIPQSVFVIYHQRLASVGQQYFKLHGIKQSWNSSCH